MEKFQWETTDIAHFVKVDYLACYENTMNCKTIWYFKKGLEKEFFSSRKFPGKIFMFQQNKTTFNKSNYCLDIFR